MSGLEAVEVNFSDINTDNEKYRFDSEFFRKHYQLAYALLKGKAHVYMADVIETLTDFHANGSYDTIAQHFTLFDEPNFAYMVRSTDLEKSDFVTGVKYVSEHCYNFLEKSKVYGGELLINKIGSPGRTYIMPTLDMPVSLGMNLFMVRLKRSSPLKNTFIWLFLNTSFGKRIIERKINGTVPLTIDKEAIRSLPIPIAGEEFQLKVEKTIALAESILQKSKSIYVTAEKMLLDELGMADFTPSSEPVAVKTFSESFGTSGRLDAEYYQLKYEEILSKLSDRKTELLADLVWIKKSIEPGSAEYISEGIPFVRVSDMTKYGITSPEIHLDRIPFANMDLQPKRDTILFSKDGTVGIAYKAEEDLDIITSGAILHLNIKGTGFVLPDYLTLVLNSMVVQMQAERDAGGSIIQHWRPSEIEKVVIPILNMNTQQELSAKIQQSFALRRQSEQLLEKAKCAVEIAIEKSEDAAIKFLHLRGES